jgi:predicted lipid-binding transport protein (Tim44 family)
LFRSAVVVERLASGLYCSLARVLLLGYVFFMHGFGQEAHMFCGFEQLVLCELLAGLARCPNYDQALALADAYYVIAQCVSIHQ